MSTKTLVILAYIAITGYLGAGTKIRQSGPVIDRYFRFKSFIRQCSIKRSCIQINITKFFCHGFAYRTFTGTRRSIYSYNLFHFHTA